MGLLGRVPPSVAWCVAAACLAGGAARAEAPTEFAVKGAYLSRFGEYVDWPEEAFQGSGSPFVIGILGMDPFDGALDQVARNRNIRGHPIVIRRLDGLDQLEQIHVLYVGKEEATHWDRIREALRGRNILTVGEEAAGPGPVISFVVLQNRVRFEIDVDAAGRANLKLSSKLLGLALKRPQGRG